VHNKRKVGDEGMSNYLSWRGDRLTLISTCLDTSDHFLQSFMQGKIILWLKPFIHSYDRVLELPTAAFYLSDRHYQTSMAVQGERSRKILD